MRQDSDLTLSPDLLARMSEFVSSQLGLYFPQERWRDLERGLLAAAPEFNFADAETCARWLLSAPLTRHMNEVLASHLSIGETYFFREKQSLEILEANILPKLLQSRRLNERRLRIWSAGCSTGEEAYTIAILLDRLIPDIKEWSITILATDFNPIFLRKAVQGIYGEWSFRDAPVGLRERYFDKRKDGRFEVNSRIKKMVTFTYLNFSEDIYPSLSNNTSAMDVIFCRNVLMYFTAQRAKQVTGNFYRALVDGGWLIVSPAEASNSLLSSFTPVEFPGAVLYRKVVKTELKSKIGEPPLAPYLIKETIEPLPVLVDQIEPMLAGVDLHAAPTESAPVSLQLDGSESLFSMARICANQGLLSEALEWCEKAITADKMNPANYYLQAAILQEQGEYASAIESLIRTLYLDSMFILGHFALGNLYHSQERYPQAQRYFSNVLSLLRNYPQDVILPEADGLTAGRLTEIVMAMLASMPSQTVAANA
ncbi:MAG: CheR family methyltransferase [Sulfuriferula sp.]